MVHAPSAGSRGPGRDEDPARYAAEPEGPWCEDEEWDDYDYAEAVAESREAAEDQARADATAARLGTTAATR